MNDALGPGASGTVVGVGIIGCGFVADYYVATLAAYDGIRVLGVADRDPTRATAFAAHHGLTERSVADILADDRVQIVVNLTNPRSHVEVTTAALEAGKHVYSEKPLAMDFEEAKGLVELADRLGLELSSAPCSLLGETAQTIWRAIRDGRVGTVRLVYAEMDEGLVHQMPFHRWKSSAGVPWPAQDEFEVGTVVEHAGYITSWLPAMFGSVETVTGLADCRISGKGGFATDGTDFAVGVLSFETGVVARVTCSLIAPHDHSLRIVGDTGVLSTRDTWFYDSPVRIQRSRNIGPRHQWLPRRRLKLLGSSRRYTYKGGHQMDFARGVADLASSLEEERPPRLSARYSLHVNEITLALDHALRHNSTYTMTTTAGPMEPMPWSR